jgi:hypothetical protein
MYQLVASEGWLVLLCLSVSVTESTGQRIALPRKSALPMPSAAEQWLRYTSIGYSPQHITHRGGCDDE